MHVEQYALDDLIKELEAAPDKPVPLGFGNPHSYRGYYEQLAFEPVADTTTGAMLIAARSALGSTYEAWKGGKYTMREHPECWLSWRGYSDGEAIGSLMLTFMLTAGELSDQVQGRLREFAVRP